MASFMIEVPGRYIDPKRNVFLTKMKASLKSSLALLFLAGTLKPSYELLTITTSSRDLP